jgi:chromosome segregation ATPase
MPGNYGWMDASEVALTDLREQVTAWRRAYDQIAAKFSEVESERDTLLARLAVAEAERDRLHEFAENVRGMPGICTCEYMSETARTVWGTCLECRAAAALATPADAGECG